MSTFLACIFLIHLQFFQMNWDLIHMITSILRLELNQLLLKQILIIFSYLQLKLK